MTRLLPPNNSQCRSLIYITQLFGWPTNWEVLLHYFHGLHHAKHRVADLSTRTLVAEDVRMPFVSGNVARVTTIANQDVTHAITVTRIPRVITKDHGEASDKDHGAVDDLHPSNESHNTTTSHLLNKNLNRLRQLAFFRAQIRTGLGKCPVFAKIRTGLGK